MRLVGASRELKPIGSWKNSKNWGWMRKERKVEDAETRYRKIRDVLKRSKTNVH